MNTRGEKPESLLEDDAMNSRQSADLLEQNTIDRFDNASRNKKRKSSCGNREYRNDSNKKYNNNAINLRLSRYYYTSNY